MFFSAQANHMNPPWSCVCFHWFFVAYDVDASKNCAELSFSEKNNEITVR